MDDERPNGVAIEQIDGQWAVQVIEDGKVTQRLFETEDFAKNYAAGQAARLGLSNQVHKAEDCGA